MQKIAIALLGSALLSSASCAHQATLPDPTVPHRVARETEVEVWVRRPDGTLTRETVRLLPGWWIAGPPVVEAEPSP